MSSPLVSVIIPMYNQQANYLRACLEGALAQTYPNIEVIVSDNHSDNGSSEILKNYSSDKRLKIVKPASHLSIIDHFVFAAAQSSGEYISFLSSDDVIYPECISKVIKPLLENKNLSFSYCENAFIDSEGNQTSLIRNLKVASGIHNKKEIAQRMYNHSEYWIIGGIIPTKYYNEIGLVKDIIAGDWIMGLKLLKFGDVAYCNETLSAIRLHEREGEAKGKYTLQYVLHQKQRISKHNAIINDRALLSDIGISEAKAIDYRDKEILNSIITLIREFHNKNITKENVKEIFDSYKGNSIKGLSSNFLIKNYTSKIALYYTYMLGFYKRIQGNSKKK